ncbi:hypothetical protein [Streptomyces longhuiensis]|uniref:hypothetical protein n=1 Tax=Streptomyces longhuiensis TaxID=2880933 RepID=UPI001D0A4BE5|nr:hypothetical protein [Streptomyces longhuiensis]UDM04798.1 hypothetical protein LGI35_44570 [Streptomyces longhuiensis]
MGERGEAAGDQRSDVAAAGADGDQGALGQAEVERDRGGVAGVSRARQIGARRDRVVDRGRARATSGSL